MRSHFREVTLVVTLCLIGASSACGSDKKHDDPSSAAGSSGDAGSAGQTASVGGSSSGGQGSGGSGSGGSGPGGSGGSPNDGAAHVQFVLKEVH
jgi:hypothetical protein